MEIFGQKKKNNICKKMTDSISISYPCENGIHLCLLWFLSQAEVGSHVTISSNLGHPLVCSWSWSYQLAVWEGHEAVS